MTSLDPFIINYSGDQCQVSLIHSLYDNEGFSFVIIAENFRLFLSLICY